MGDSRPIKTPFSRSSSCSQLSLPLYSSSLFPCPEGTSSFPCKRTPTDLSFSVRPMYLWLLWVFPNSIPAGGRPGVAEVGRAASWGFTGCHGRGRTAGGRRRARWDSPCRFFLPSAFFFNSSLSWSATFSRFHCLFTGFLSGLGLLKWALFGFNSPGHLKKKKSPKSKSFSETLYVLDLTFTCTGESEGCSGLTTKELQQKWRMLKRQQRPCRLLFEISSTRVVEEKLSKYVVRCWGLGD